MGLFGPIEQEDIQQIYSSISKSRRKVANIYFQTYPEQNQPNETWFCLIWTTQLSVTVLEIPMVAPELETLCTPWYDSYRNGGLYRVTFLFSLDISNCDNWHIPAIDIFFYLCCSSFQAVLVVGRNGPIYTTSRYYLVLYKDLNPNNFLTFPKNQNPVASWTIFKIIRCSLRYITSAK